MNSIFIWMIRFFFVTLYPKKKSCSVGTTKVQNIEYKEKDFLKVYDEVYKRTQSVVRLQVSEICRIAAESEAPHFYVTCEWAVRQYNLWKRTGKISSNQRTTVAMFMEIFKRFEVLYDQYGDVSFKYGIMQKVLDGPAPCFYMEPNTAFKFYYRAMSNKRRRARK